MQQFACDPGVQQLFLAYGKMRPGLSQDDM